MGNMLSGWWQVVDEKYTRPQGLYQHKDVDLKELRILILDSKLAPCYVGVEDEERAFDLEECPICFLYYPSLNRSRCCRKSICTECYLQMKPIHFTRPTQCPFCKTSNYAVEYHGMRSKEEKVLEQVEEQRFIEAQIRMQRQELQDEEERMQRRQDMSSSCRIVTAGELGYTDVSRSSFADPSFSSPIGGDEIVSSHISGSAPIIGQPSCSRQKRSRGGGSSEAGNGGAVVISDATDSRRGGGTIGHRTGRKSGARGSGRGGGESGDGSAGRSRVNTRGGASSSRPGSKRRKLDENDGKWSSPPLPLRRSGRISGMGLGSSIIVID